MKSRFILLVIIAMVVGSLSSCDVSNHINHPHFKHPRGKGDRWTRNEITMMQQPSIDSAAQL